MAGIDYADTAQSFVVTLTDADTEYSLELPAGVKAIEFQARTAADVRWSFTSGKVAAPTDPYRTLKSGGVYSKSNLYFSAPRNIYFAGGAGVIVEVTVWL